MGERTGFDKEKLAWLKIMAANEKRLNAEPRTKRARTPSVKETFYEKMVLKQCAVCQAPLIKHRKMKIHSGRPMCAECARVMPALVKRVKQSDLKTLCNFKASLVRTGRLVAGTDIARARVNAKMTKQEFAYRIGVSPQTLANMEQREVCEVSIAMISCMPQVKSLGDFLYVRFTACSRAACHMVGISVSTLQRMFKYNARMAKKIMEGESPMPGAHFMRLTQLREKRVDFAINLIGQIL